MTVVMSWFCIQQGLLNSRVIGPNNSPCSCDLCVYNSVPEAGVRGGMEKKGPMLLEQLRYPGDSLSRHANVPLTRDTSGDLDRLRIALSPWYWSWSTQVCPCARGGWILNKTQHWCSSVVKCATYWRKARHSLSKCITGMTYEPISQTC